MPQPSVQEIEAHVRRVPPDCLASFRTVPVVVLDRSNPSIRPIWPSPGPFKALWRLRCQCGSQRGGLLGHNLRDYNPDYRGDDLVTPIAFKCESCSRATEILDTAVHGYHAEVAKLDGGIGSAQIRGTGHPSGYRCRQCGNDVLDLITGFVHWHFDIILDEPALPARNFFHEFLMLCTCTRCGGISEPVVLGKL